MSVAIRFTALLVSALTALAGARGTQEPEAKSPPVAAQPATRVAVIGASLSAGTGNNIELVTGRDVKFGRFLGCVLPEGLATIEDRGDIWFFTNPVEKGRAQVDALLAEPKDAPTLVIALDFLFWYGYGSGYANVDGRLADLELGLAQLDRFVCPILISDLPDIRMALAGKGPLGTPLVTPNMIPSEAELVRLNRRIAEWMSKRPRVTQVPLGPMLARMQRGEELVLRGNAWRPTKVTDVLQTDLLHPTARGTIWVALMTVDTLVQHRKDLATLECTWDEHRAHERLITATADERAAEIEKRAKREERRKRAEERKRIEDTERKRIEDTERKRIEDTERKGIEDTERNRAVNKGAANEVGGR